MIFQISVMDCKLQIFVLVYLQLRQNMRVFQKRKSTNTSKDMLCFLAMHIRKQEMVFIMPHIMMYTNME